MFKRYFSCFLEFFILINCIFLPLALILNSIELISSKESTVYVLGTIGWSIIFLKDIFLGASPFKKLLGLKVVDINTNIAATPLKTIIRNSTLILLLPIEMLVILFSPKRRIGDLIAKTKLIEVEKIPFKKLGQSFCLNSKLNLWILVGISTGLVIAELQISMILFLTIST